MWEQVRGYVRFFSPNLTVLLAKRYGEHEWKRKRKIHIRTSVAQWEHTSIFLCETRWVRTKNDENEQANERTTERTNEQPNERANIGERERDSHQKRKTHMWYIRIFSCAIAQRRCLRFHFVCMCMCVCVCIWVSRARARAQVCVCMCVHILLLLLFVCTELALGFAQFFLSLSFSLSFSLSTCFHYYFGCFYVYSRSSHSAYVCFLWCFIFIFSWTFFPFILIRIYEVDYSMENKKGKIREENGKEMKREKCRSRSAVVVVVKDDKEEEEEVEFVLNVENEQKKIRCVRVRRCERLRENERSGKLTKKMRA